MLKNIARENMVHSIGLEYWLGHTGINANGMTDIQYQ